MADIQLSARPRTRKGRKVRALRREGIVPVIVYGNVDDPQPLQVEARELETLLVGGSSRLVQMHVEGGQMHNVLIRDVQRHPVTRKAMHADFYAVNMLEKQHVSVPVIGHGRPESLELGLMFLQALETVEVEALPNDLPASIEIDVTNVTMDEPITVGDLPAIAGVEYLTDSDETVFTIVTTREESDLEELEGEPEEGVEPEIIAEMDGEEGEEGQASDDAEDGENA